MKVNVEHQARVIAALVPFHFNEWKQTKLSIGCVQYVIEQAQDLVTKEKLVVVEAESIYLDQLGSVGITTEMDTHAVLKDWIDAFEITIPF